QKREQGQIFAQFGASDQKIPTWNKCLECHAKQTDFWQTTSHSLAYTTLIKAQHQFDQSCIKCHTLGHQDPKGFMATQNLIQSSDKNFEQQKYWTEALKGVITSVRKMSKKERTRLSKQLQK